MQEKSLDYRCADIQAEGFLVRPESKSPLPAVMICHAWKGLLELTKTKARAVAEMGVDCLLTIGELTRATAAGALEAGANIVVEEIPDLSHLPPASRLQGPSGVTLTVDLQNRPCSVVSRTIEAARNSDQDESQERADEKIRFKSAAQGRRGVTLYVERPGILRVGDELSLFIPNQRPWRSNHS